MILKHIIVSYTNICLLKGIMLRIVPYFNIKLTFIYGNYFHNFVKINKKLMTLTPRKLNAFTIFKLPSAFFCGVRTKYIDSNKCVVSVKHRWINQNPFNSMFWAVQGMAAEFSTGALMISKIKNSGKRVSMLVTSNTASFSKKATGRIMFTCNDGHLIDAALKRTIETGEGQTVSMKSVGVNAEGIQVSTFVFEWSIKLKN